MVSMLAVTLSLVASVFLNGVNIDGLRGQTFEKCKTVRIDERGDVHLDCPAYQVEQAPTAAPAQQPPAATGASGAVPASATVPAALTKHYWLVTEQTENGAAQYDMDIWINSKWLGRKGSDLWVAVDVPVTSLCPCSKAISDHGAHNQRSLVSVRVWFAKFFWIEDLIKLVEDSASSDLYALLKRPDEKYVTERAYERPRFVEDLVREVGTRLRADPNFTRWEVEAESFESIHAHSAYASLRKP